MALTKKSSYGLIAALELAANVSQSPLSARTIAAKYALPVPFVEKILHRLKVAGVVEARKGRGGGYSLAVNPARTSVLRVLEALDGDGLAQRRALHAHGRFHEPDALVGA